MVGNKEARGGGYKQFQMMLQKRGWRARRRKSAGEIDGNKTEELRRFSDPPENPGQDFPLLLTVQHHRLIITILGLQHFG